MSESDVLISFNFAELRLLAVEHHAALEQVFRDRLLDEHDGLAGKGAEVQAVADEYGVVAVRIVADDDGGGVDPGRGGKIEGLHVGHGAGVYIFGDESVKRRGIVEPLHLDGDAVPVRPLLENAGLLHVEVGVPSRID